MSECVPRVFNVQVSDHKAKTMRTMDRAVPGAGIAPVGRLLHALADGGYRGWWDLEVISDDNAAVGYEVALATVVRALHDVWAAGRAMSLNDDLANDRTYLWCRAAYRDRAVRPRVRGLEGRVSDQLGPHRASRIVTSTRSLACSSWCRAR